MAVDIPDNIFLTKLDAAANWARSNSLWPMPFATACCGIELMATASSRYDISRFGAEVMQFSPRQCDLLIVAGRVVMKMLPVLQRIWLQMPEPKWCISMGACACTGGVFDTYAVVQGVDRFIPVDLYVPGCPPRPEQLLASIIDLQSAIMKHGTLTGKEVAERRTADGAAPRSSLEELARGSRDFLLDQCLSTSGKSSRHLDNRHRINDGPIPGIRRRNTRRPPNEHHRRAAKRTSRSGRIRGQPLP